MTAVAPSLRPDLWDLSRTCAGASCRAALNADGLDAGEEPHSRCPACGIALHRCKSPDCRAWNRWEANRCRRCGRSDSLDADGIASKALARACETALHGGAQRSLGMESISPLHRFFPGWPHTPDSGRTRLFASQGRIFLIGPTGLVAAHDPDALPALDALAVLEAGAFPIGSCIDGRYLIIGTERTVEVLDLDLGGGQGARRTVYRAPPGDGVQAGPFLWKRDGPVLVLIKSGGELAWTEVQVAPELEHLDPASIQRVAGSLIAAAQASGRGILWRDAEGVSLLKPANAPGGLRRVADASRLLRFGLAADRAGAMDGIQVLGSDVCISGPSALDAGGRTLLRIANYDSPSPQITAAQIELQRAALWHLAYRGHAPIYLLREPGAIGLYSEFGHPHFTLGRGRGDARPICVEGWCVLTASSPGGQEQLLIVGPQGERVGEWPVGPVGLELVWRPPWIYFIEDLAGEGPTLRRLGPLGSRTQGGTP